MQYTHLGALLAALQLVYQVGGSPVTSTIRIGRCLVNSTGSISSTGQSGVPTGGPISSLPGSGGASSVSTTISSVSTSGQTVSTGPSTSISTSAVIPSTSTSSTSGYTYGTATSTTAPSVSSSQYPSSSSSGSLSLPATTTAPGTTASSTGTSSTAGQTQLILARPTPIITNLDLATYYQGDDEALEVTLPFAMELFGSVSSNIYVSTNGLLTFDTGSTSYANGPLPQSTLPPVTLAAYWEDLLAEGGTQQGVYYQIDDSASQSTVTFEYLLASLGIQDQYYHFLVSYQTSNPGVVKVYYFLAADGGSGATVAVQGPNGNGLQAIGYANNGSPPIAPGQVVTFDTNLGTATLGTFNNACYTPNSWPKSTC